MKYINLLLVIAASIVGLSCEKEDAEFRIWQFETPIITGYEVRTKSGEIYGTVGTPNIKTGNESNTNDSEYFMSPYPNPSVDFISLVLNAPQSNSEKNMDCRGIV